MLLYNILLDTLLYCIHFRFCELYDFRFPVNTCYFTNLLLAFDQLCIDLLYSQHPINRCYHVQNTDKLNLLFSFESMIFIDPSTLNRCPYIP